MLTLGIETSCDETAVAIIKNSRGVISNVVSSSLELHKRYGGIVPEIAYRAHVEVINYIIDEALKKAKVKLKEVDLVAVTQGPGLVGALLVGISSAKSISLASNIPLVGVNHLIAHLYANFLGKKIPKFPFIGLVISGGHTSIFLIEDVDKWVVLGRTRDDAIGEAFDKVAKILKLGFPGGPIIDRLAKKGDTKRINFTCARLGESLDFSFSGIKTAVLYYVRHQTPNTKHQTPNKADIATSFQEAVVDILIKKALSACRRKKIKSLVLGGGVSANSRLRDKLIKEGRANNIEVYFPPIEFCLDNAAMVAGLGYQLYKKGIVSDLALTAVPNL
jgi:N6-L-threonylcarbamoyladenine synthase